jgi:hypothetical protein
MMHGSEDEKNNRLNQIEEDTNRLSGPELLSSSLRSYYQAQPPKVGEQAKRQQKK